MRFTVIRGNKTLAYRGYKDGQFVICGNEPEFLTGVKDPILIDDQNKAESLAKKYGGEIKYTSTRPTTTSTAKSSSVPKHVAKNSIGLPAHHKASESGSQRSRPNGSFF